MARGAAAHVFVEDLEVPALEADDLHHLVRVLRLRAGERVSVADGTGGWRPAAWVDGGRLEPLADAVRVVSPSPAITIAMAVPKGDRAEWAVAKLTELGVDRIVPLVTTRGVVRWDARRAGRSLERWRALARQASMQSRRLRLPVIDEPVTPALLAADPDSRSGVAMAEPGGPAPSLERPMVLVGPEGGWADDERALGLPAVGLTPSVLRTETAAVAAAAVLVMLRSGHFRP